MITNQLKVSTIKPIFKNSDKSRWIPLARYLANTLKKEKSTILEHGRASRGDEIVTYYEETRPKYVHTIASHQSPNITYKKTTPIM